MATSRENSARSRLPDGHRLEPEPVEIAPNALVAHGDELVQLDGVKARQFLHSLARRPFVTLVIEGDTLKVYCKGMTEDDAELLMEEWLARE